jgi:hypothetical protein
MRRAAALAVWVLCSSCGRHEPPAAAAPRPTPAPPPPPPRVSVPVPAPEPPAAPAPFTPPAPKPVQAPRAGPEAPPSKTPLFTFDSLDARAEIRINGAPVGTTPLSWALADSTCFDPRIPVDAWPPPHAMLASKSSFLTEFGWTTTELWINGAKYADDDREAFRRLHPHVAEDEHVVFVRSGNAQGAFRLRVEGRRFVLHRPSDVTQESEGFHRWNRSLWFARE